IKRLESLLSRNSDGAAWPCGTTAHEALLHQDAPKPGAAIRRHRQHAAYRRLGILRARIENAQVGGKHGRRVRAPPEQMPGREIVTIGILKCTLLLDGEYLLARSEHRIEFIGREIRKPRLLPAKRNVRPGRRRNRRRIHPAEHSARCARRRVYGTAGKSAANERFIAAAITAKSLAGTRTTPKRNAAPQCVLLRTNHRSGSNGLTRAGSAGRKSTSRRKGRNPSSISA